MNFFEFAANNARLEFPGRSYGEGALDGMAEAPQVSCGTVDGHGGFENGSLSAKAMQGETLNSRPKVSGYQAPPAGTIFTGVAAGEAGAVTRRAAPEFLTLTERCLMVADRTLAERRAK